MSSQIPPGRVGNLTPDQVEKLRMMWQSIFQLEQMYSDSTLISDAHENPSSDDPDPLKKKGRFGMFRKKGSDKSGTSSTPVSDLSITEDDKYGQTRQFHDILAKESPEAIRATIWSMVKHDHPDALVLRFLRARKWDVEKALIMLVSTMSWRQNEMNVDDEIMTQGEAGALQDEKGQNDEAKILGHDFLAQMRMGKSFLHGIDKQGRPICVVRVRLHKQGAQCEKSLERYTVYLIETTRMALRPPIDTATIIFDMTGFSLANMDYTPVKFMIKCFEANYPESLGAVLVHNAPWIFQGIWRIIRGWLDPVVAAKVHFTNNRNDLEEFIEPSRILEELGGDEKWHYKYVEPIAGENDLMKDEETKNRLLLERTKLMKEFEAATLRWVKEDGIDDGERVGAKRESLAKQLRDGYWRLDPYIRARSLYDRQGILQGGVEVNWYGSVTRNTTDQKHGVVAPDTSFADID